MECRFFEPLGRPCGCPDFPGLNWCSTAACALLSVVCFSSDHLLTPGLMPRSRARSSKVLSAFRVSRREIVDFHEPPDDRVDVVRINLDAVSTSPGLFGSDQRGAAAGEGVQNDPAAVRAIEDGVGDERDRFDRRMHGKLGVPLLAEGVHAGIGPDIGAVASEAAQFDIVDVAGSAVFEHEDQFVLGAVEATHAGIGLGPDAEVLELAVGACGIQHLAHVAPVHAYIV